MSNYEILNKQDHQQLRIKTGYSAALGDAAMYVMTYPMEFRDIQHCYPILFTKDTNTGGFFAAAILGFEADQNLFLKNDEWDAPYVPMLAKRQPFLIATGNENEDKPPVVSLDLDHPRVSQDEGEPLFNDDGEPTEFLKQRIGLLDQLHRGLQHGNGFIEALVQHELLEQITVDIAFINGEKRR